MSWVTRLYYLSRRWWKAIRLFLMIAGPGIVVMVAENDAGSITTYAATGARMLMETNPYTGTFEVQALSMPSLASPSALCARV